MAALGGFVHLVTHGKRMHLRFLLTLAAVAAPLAAASPAEAARFVPDEVIVRYVAGSSVAARASVQRRARLGRSRKLPGGSRRLAIRDGETVRETLAELRADPRVEHAVPNHIARASFLPNDPGLGGPLGWRALQWNFFGPAGVNGPEAWDLARAAGAPGGRGAVVAVLDSGVAYEDRGRFRRAPDLRRDRFVGGYDFVDDDRRANDENGHGTHITGTIAQRTNNAAGVTGLAYGVKIMPVRVLDDRGGGDNAAIGRAIRFAARRGADVIAMALEFEAGLQASDIPDVVSAIRYASRRGAVMVSAAGNVGYPVVAYPGRATGVIAVGATTDSGCQASYSNSGNGLDLVAPGGGSDAAHYDNPYDAAHCSPGGRGRYIYQQTFAREKRVRSFGLPATYQGTSMASAHVAASAALLIASRRLGRDPTPAAVEERLEATARDVGVPGVDSRYGAGLLDAAAALRR